MDLSFIKRNFNSIKNFTRRWRCHGGLSQIKFALRPWDGPVGRGPLFHFFRTQNSRLAIFFILKSFTCKLSIYSNCWKTLNKFFSSSVYKPSPNQHLTTLQPVFHPLTLLGPSTGHSYFRRSDFSLFLIITRNSTKLFSTKLVISLKLNFSFVI